MVATDITEQIRSWCRAGQKVVLLGVTVGTVLAALDAAGLRVVSAAFDRERLVLGTR